MDRATLIEKIAGIRRLMTADTISANFRDTHVMDHIRTTYEDAGRSRMSQHEFYLAVRNERNTTERVADRLLEAMEPSNG